MTRPLLPKTDMIVSMCKRVDLPLRIGNRIYAMAIECGFRIGKGPDMVLVAQAISYAAKNKHLIKEQYKQ